MQLLNRTGGAIGRLAIVVLALTGPALSASAQSHYEGATGPGASYEIDVPEPWNGDLVLYAHGIVEASLPVALPGAQDGYSGMRARLLSAGFAVAASSFSSNGWSLDDAVRRTHQLSGIFASRVGRPVRTFLAGHSMGALAVVKLAEQQPSQYDGVLAMCGPLGGANAELQYAGDARVTFDYFFPGLLPGSAFSVPPGTVYEVAPPSPLFISVFTALSANPAATFQWAMAAKLPFANPSELGNSALYVVGFLLRYTNDFVERTNGKIPFDNQQVNYRLDVTADPATNDYLSGLLNSGVERFNAGQAALNYYNRNYEPTGQISVPVVTLHTLRDPAIPFAHETKFAQTVAAAGNSSWLTQHAIDRWGHCAFTPGEVDSAFADLFQQAARRW